MKWTNLCRAKLVYEKTGIPSKSTKKKSKPGWEIIENGQNPETCCHSNSREKPSANTDVKNSKGPKN